MKLKLLLFLALGYLIFLFIGAGIFHALEKPLEKQRCEDAASYVDSLLNNTHMLNRNMTHAEIVDVIIKISSFRSQGIQFRNSNNSLVFCPDSWSFQGAFVFAGTIITTIGYGNVTPTTEVSRLIVILYALIGIPIFAILFAGLATLVGHSSKNVLKYLDKLNLSQRWNSCLMLIAFAVLGFTLFSLFPAIMFHFYEGWSYFDSIYFTIITLTTIGFGDFVAANTRELYPQLGLFCTWLQLFWLQVQLLKLIRSKPGRESGGNQQYVWMSSNPAVQYFLVYKIMVYFWILFGLGFMATFINVISESFKTQATEIANRVSRDRSYDKETGDASAEEEEHLQNGTEAAAEKPSKNSP